MLFCTNGEELGDNFKWHPLCLRYLEVHKNPRDSTYDCINAKDSREAKGFEHDWESVSDDYVTNPESEGADGDAETAHRGREDL